MKKLLSIQQQLQSVATAMILFRLGSNIAGVFIPFVVLQRGGELWMVAAFYLVYSAVKAACNYPFMRINQRKGPHYGMGLGFLAGVLQLVAVLGYAVLGELAFLVIGAVSLGISNAFLWTAQHLFVSQVIDDRTRSSNIASIEIFGRLSDVAGPLIGGFIGAAFGADWVLAAAISVILLTTVPLRRMGYISLPKGLPAVRYNLRGAPAQHLLANFFWNTETTIGIMLWPMFLAVYLAGYQSIGWAAAAAALAAVIVTWLAGQNGDRGHNRTVLKTGAILTSLVDITRFFVSSPLSITAVGVAYRSSLSYLQNAWTSTYYGNAKKLGPQYIMSMEIICDLAYLTIWGSLLAVLLVTNNPEALFGAAFAVAPLAALGTMFLREQK